jgi:hypothetical protein
MGGKIENATTPWHDDCACVRGVVVVALAVDRGIVYLVRSGEKGTGKWYAIKTPVENEVMKVDFDQKKRAAHPLHYHRGIADCDLLPLFGRQMFLRTADAPPSLDDAANLLRTGVGDDRKPTIASRLG